MGSFVELTQVTCWCGTPFSMPSRLYEACRKDSSNNFHCPHGHSNVFRESLSDKYRRERDQMKQRLAQKDDRIREERERTEAAERSTRAYKGQATKLRKRAKAGVCPCCNRQFSDLHRHMETKHPNFGPDEPLKVIEGGKKSA